MHPVAGLRFNQVGFTYPGPAGRRVLHDCSREFGAGVHLLRGPSGCGKSTVLRLLAGYLEPGWGTVHTHDGRSPGSRTYQLQRMGFVFQSINLLELITVRQNVEMAGLLAGLPRPEARQRSLAWLDRLGLADLADERPNRISGGQRQRAAFARALVKHPDVLLLDEPTSGLDETNTELLARVFMEFQREHATQRIVVVAAHDDRLRRYADHEWQFTAEGPSPA